MCVRVCLYLCLSISKSVFVCVCSCLFVSDSVCVCGYIMAVENVFSGNKYEIIGILISIWATYVNEHESINIIW